MGFLFSHVWRSLIFCAMLKFWCEPLICTYLMQIDIFYVDFCYPNCSSLSFQIQNLKLLSFFINSSLTYITSSLKKPDNIFLQIEFYNCVNIYLGCVTFPWMIHPASSCNNQVSSIVLTLCVFSKVKIWIYSKCLRTIQLVSCYPIKNKNCKFTLEMKSVLFLIISCDL